jgi:Sulfatase
VTDRFGTWTLGGAQLAAVREKYVEEASHVDSFVGRVLGRLKGTGAYQSSLVIAASDHGQALKERGYYGHGTLLYDEIVKVPLIVKFPGGSRPKPADGFQTHEGIAEAVKDSLVGINDGSSLARKHAVSESFGINFGLERVKKAPGYEAKRESLDRPRKAAFMGGYKLVVEGKGGSVEEFTKGGLAVETSSERGVYEQMISAMKETGDREFVYSP